MVPVQAYALVNGAGIQPNQLIDPPSVPNQHQAFLPLSGPSTSTHSPASDAKPRDNGTKGKKRPKEESLDSGDEAQGAAEGSKKPVAKRNRAALS